MILKKVYISRGEGHSEPIQEVSHPNWIKSFSLCLFLSFLNNYITGPHEHYSVNLESVFHF